MNFDSIRDKLAYHTPHTIGRTKPVNFSVLLPLIRKEGELHVIFEVRSLTMRRQPGEVCFPGGMADEEDNHLQDTAIREMCEELGTRPEEVTDIWKLGTLLSPFGPKIHAYVGSLDKTEDFVENPGEVEESFTVPLSFFLENEPTVHYIDIDVRPREGFPYDDIANGKTYEWQTIPYEENFYYFEDKVIWGLTARILKSFVHVIKN
ncbi:NUDIX hydrolase [Salimicrobium flavidum]|uniref:8-oxo-dGTP pyrophosphatase MutT, NUDIX family n=1 Tax=Salimicrobium flavidum TaxID=570947 RepID=A0A1N7JA03_9BACI|nr:CoA pyrophosphatase [Salimicrobium flavidum]SIS46066.1 8-oxo-dGTP pyrophosphatase MutT, NUDIX family [Salimicrobium flavidum]